jgi:hypothetical protein
MLKEDLPFKDSITIPRIMLGKGGLFLGGGLQLHRTTKGHPQLSKRAEIFPCVTTGNWSGVA